VVHVHQVLGGFVVAINLVACIWAFLVYRGTITAGRAFTQVLALSHTVILGQAAIGLLLLSSQHRAPVQLHYLYGLAPAVGVIPDRGPAPQHPRVRRRRARGHPVRHPRLHDRDGVGVGNRGLHWEA
jgi:hypothetical protein